MTKFTKQVVILIFLVRVVILDYNHVCTQTLSLSYFNFGNQLWWKLNIRFNRVNCNNLFDNKLKIEWKPIFVLGLTKLPNFPTKQPNTTQIGLVFKVTIGWVGLVFSQREDVAFNWKIFQTQPNLTHTHP